MFPAEISADTVKYTPNNPVSGTHADHLGLYQKYRRPVPCGVQAPAEWSRHSIHPDNPAGYTDANTAAGCHPIGCFSHRRACQCRCLQTLWLSNKSAGSCRHPAPVQSPALAPCVPPLDIHAVIAVLFLVIDLVS